MARRNARVPQGKKLQPAVKTMAFRLPRSSTNFVDLSESASILNRRFYRQGLNWAVAGFTFFTQGNGEINISKIPDTWVASNAWEKGFHAWMKMNDEALEEAESIKPKFLDFKVYMDEIHHQNGSAANALPIDRGQNVANPGDWDYSKYLMPIISGAGGETTSVVTRDIIWVGANYPGASPATGFDAVSLIDGYSASRALPDPEDPNTPLDAASATGDNPQNWQSALFADGTLQLDEVLGDLTEDNVRSPYPFEGDGTNLDTMYPGGPNQLPDLQVHDTLLVTSTTVGGKTTSHGSNFQGGLIRVDCNISAGGDDIVGMLIHLVPGPHRGYMCQPMQDV